MAIAQTSASNNASSGTSTSCTVTPTGSNTMILALIAVDSGATLSAATAGGSAMTLVTRFDGNSYTLYMYYFLGASGSTSVAATSSASHISIAASAYSGVNQAAPEVNIGANTGPGSDVSIIMPGCTSGAWAVMGVGTNQTSGSQFSGSSGNTNWTNRAGGNTNHEATIGDSNGTFSPPLTQNAHYASGSAQMGGISVSIAPVAVASPGTVRALVIAGGGSGGTNTFGSSGRFMGGGGAGGMQENQSFAVTYGTYSITVGAGGGAGSQGGSNGSDSIFSSITSTGGGSNHNNGGSGGGGYWINSAQTPGTGTVGQGHDGSAADSSHGGGGGGAGAAASTPTGGAGQMSTITGVGTYYAGGAGGGTQNDSSNTGGVGGGGNGAINSTGNSTSGTANTGGGGGGGSADTHPNGSDGGSGVVIVSFATADASLYSNTGSPTVTTVGSYTVWKFTANGSFIYTQPNQGSFFQLLG